jgi:NAD(P)-dependent dehydrogenase (short-subunit alcohol dehydrogenase family)
MMGKLEGRVAIVTGSGWGFGPAISLALAHEGADVVLVDLTLPPIRDIASEITQLGGRALAVACDVADGAQVHQMVTRGAEAFGRIDILVNSPQRFGLTDDLCMPPRVSLEDLSEECWEHTFQTGVKAAFLCSKAVFPQMKERGGKIINIGSDVGIRGAGLHSHYAANAEALRGLTKSAAFDWGEYGINVNVITPTGQSAASAVPAATEGSGRQQARRVIRGTVTPEDAGALAVFLASAATDYVTGQTFVLGGSVVL